MSSDQSVSEATTKTSADKQAPLDRWATVRRILSADLTNWSTPAWWTKLKGILFTNLTGPTNTPAQPRRPVSQPVPGTRSDSVRRIFMLNLSSNHATDITLNGTADAGATCREAVAQLGWRVLSETDNTMVCKEANQTFSALFTWPARFEISWQQCGGKTLFAFRGTIDGVGPIQSGHLKRQLRKLQNQIQRCFWIATATTATGTQGAQPSSETRSSSEAAPVHQETSPAVGQTASVPGVPPSQPLALAFCKCPRCEIPVFLICPNCDNSAKWVIDADGALCGCGHRTVEVLCPSCNATAYKQAFTMQPPNEEIRQAAINHQATISCNVIANSQGDAINSFAAVKAVIGITVGCALGFSLGYQAWTIFSLMAGEFYDVRGTAYSASRHFIVDYAWVSRFFSISGLILGGMAGLAWGVTGGLRKLR